MVEEHLIKTSHKHLRRLAFHISPMIAASTRIVLLVFYAMFATGIGGVTGFDAALVPVEAVMAVHIFLRM